MAGLLNDGALMNLHAQARARMLLVQIAAPEESWPEFTPNLDERLLYSAHLMLARGLELLDAPSHGTTGQELLKRGAEALEFLVAVPQERLSPFAERVNSAIAYHVAGYHARAYVMVTDLAVGGSDAGQVQGVSAAVLALLRRDLRAVSLACLDSVSDSESQDGTVADRLRIGEANDDDAVGALGRRSLCKALLRYVEYVKSGDEYLVDDARIICRRVAILGQEARHVDLWWLGLAIERLLRDLGGSSLWRGLRDLAPTTHFPGALTRYIESGLVGTVATVSLWPSQLNALDMVKSPGAPSFLVRMPTSAGKTKIAEFCILRALLESGEIQGAKCLYVAPFRSLAVEVEATLSRSLRSIGVRVSEVYGGFELTESDERVIQDTQVIVATPEKFDAMIRLKPDVLGDVRLVIVDEGHIAGDISERGLRTEFLLNRLLWRLGRDTCRHVFVSAVIPNPDEFAAWIGGDGTSRVESDWRPSRLLIGECTWSEKRGSVGVSFTHEGSARLEQEIFGSPSRLVEASRA